MNNNELLTVIFEMSKTTRCCQQDLLFCEGITFTQFYILELVAQNGSLKLTELHTLLSVEKSTTTRLIEPLVKQEFLKRARDITDARIITITLSKKGEEVRDQFWKCLNNFLDLVKEEIGQDNLEDIMKSVEVFLKAIKVVFRNKNCCN